MKVFTKFYETVLCMTLLLLVGFILTSCHLFDRSASHAPTSPSSEELQDFNALYGREHGKRFRYEVSDTAGITISADFTKYHIEGQPYGTWVVNATWRNKDRDTIAEVTVPVSIDEQGIGIALISAEFLDAVFAEAHTRFKENEDASVWFHRPGLYLNFYPDEETWQYYSFQ